MTNKSNSTSRAAHWRPQTQAIHGGSQISNFGETSEAMFLTSGYGYDSPEQAEARFKGTEDGYIYSRYGNPTVSMYEDRMAALEGGENCWATSSGMAAISGALLCQLKSGDRVVAARALFGSSLYVLNEILPRFGIAVTLVDGTDLDQLREALAGGATTVLVESPSNPTLEILDIAEIAKLSHNAGATLIVDNVFATPFFQRPIELGADIVVYSATKYVDGQGRVLGGAIIGTEEFCTDVVQPYIRNTGPSLSPFNAWVLLKGMETMELRIRAQTEAAAKVADFLANAPGVDRVLYPGRADHPQHALAASQMTGFGAIVSFDISGGKEGAFQVLNRLQLISVSNNLGDTKSLITHPETTTHHRLTREERAALGIGSGLVRLSVGLEHIEDLTEDLGAALGKV
ncbi:MAG: O-succinylhomoserine sulfhydrylase [Alphaproteobacteria bacterium]|nr:O-succinylhomoserine sulfhydrylase [Alphaproteobacteria bacterium]